MKPKLLAVLLAMLLSVLLAIIPIPALAVTLTRHPYVQRAAHDSIWVVWKTDEASDSIVEYGPDPSYDLKASDPAPVLQHAVQISGLAPGTRYSYRVSSAGTVLAADLSFTTYPAPDSAAPFSFIAFGDSGGGTQAQLDVAARIAASEKAFGIHIGDIAYPGGIPEDLDRLYFDVYREMLQSVVIFTALGNKDVESDGGAAVLDAYYLPENSPAPERYYSFVHSSAHFIALDTNADLSPGSAQRSWLEAQLSGSDRFWKLVFFHHPVYSSARGEFTHRAYLEPLFNQYKVDLVFQGHNHFYERTFPIAAGTAVDKAQEPNYADPLGTIYLVTGGGGGTLATASPNGSSARYKSTYHHLALKVDDNVLSLSAIDSTGAVIDAMSLTKKKPGPPPIVFHRGDADSNGELQITDAIRTLGFLFLGTAEPECLEAADTDDNGQIQLTDAIRSLNFSFIGGAVIPPPGPPGDPCGPDPEGSPDVGCGRYTGCE